MRAVVLLSGGLDSSTTLAIATKEDGCDCYALSFSYGQVHEVELDAAKKVTEVWGRNHRIVHLRSLHHLLRSALTGHKEIPKDRPEGEIGRDIPVTYVPGRNIIFLSIAAAYAESIGADRVYIGVNAVDYSGYPDCRSEFINAFQQTLWVGTKKGVEGKPVEVCTPIIRLKKAEIIHKGLELGLDYGDTWSCYDPQPSRKLEDRVNALFSHENWLACGHCDSCVLRLKAFKELGILDPVKYVEDAP